MPDDVHAILDRDGYVVLRRLVDPAPARAYAMTLLDGIPWSDNDFDGRRTRRAYGLLPRLGALEPLLLHPSVRDLVTGRLGADHQLGMLFLTAVDPGQGGQSPHHDAGIYPLPRDLELETNVIWALDDFTAENGATVVAPGSHRWPTGRRPSPEELVPVVMPAGSAIIYSGQLWHAAGHNRSAAPRTAFIHEQVRPWLRPADNHLLPLTRTELRALSPTLRMLSGLTPVSPYLGLVSGRPPTQWLEDTI